MSGVLFRFEDVSLAFQAGRPVLRGVNADVREGDFVEIRGASGSGKSSFLRLVNRLLDPTEGRILYKEAPIVQVPVTSLRRHVSYLPQTPVLLDASIRENLGLAFRFRSAAGDPGPGDADLNAWLHRFLLEELSLDQSALECSVGQQQRLCLIRALLLNPNALLLDEPASSLDPESAAVVNTEMLRLNRDVGVTVLMVTHTPRQEIVHAARRRWTLRDGRMWEE